MTAPEYNLQDQNSSLMETCPVRLPPKSEPRAEVIVPNFGSDTSSVGSARFVWFRMFVKVPSARSLRPSVIANVLLNPADRLTVPGPSMEPI